MHSKTITPEEILKVWPEHPDPDKQARLANELILSLETFADFVYQTNVSKGYHPEGRSDWELLALIHSEVTEVVEEYRKDPKAPHHTIPGVSKVEVDLGDIFIRTLDLAAKRNYNVGKAMVLKALFNASGRKPNG